MENEMVVTQPVAVRSPTTFSRDWSTGICQCCEDIPSCCFSFWCFWCFTCQTSKEFGEQLCLPLADWCLGGVVKPVTMSMRAVMRRRYGIEGSLFNDCVYSTFCMPCVWCQMSREMKTRVQPTIFVSSYTR